MCITLYFCPAFAWYCGFVNEDICLFVVAIAKEKFTLVRPLPNPNLGTINESVKKADVAVQAFVTSPHVLMPEEEKIIMDDGDPSNLQEKTLVDTVYSLKDQVRMLEKEHKKMKHDLEEEKKARRRLETSVKKSMKSNNLIWEETPT